MYLDTYQHERNQDKCIDCDIEHFVCNGGDDVSILPGFWREHQYSTNVSVCVNNRKACLFGKLYYY